MRKIVYVLCLVLLSAHFVQAGNFNPNGNWIRATIDIKEKGWSSGDGHKVKAELVSPPDNISECKENENWPDKALRFDVRKLYNDVNDTSFDVNNIYVDGVWDGERALEVIQADNLRHHNGWQFRYLWKEKDHAKDWTQYNGYVYACVGSLVQLETSNHGLRNIILWYKNPNKTTYRNVSSSDICNASGTNWLQKILGRAQADLVNTFCGNSNNKASVTFDTQNNTATFVSKVPLKANGSETLTISFSQAGVSSAQVKSFLVVFKIKV